MPFADMDLIEASEVDFEARIRGHLRIRPDSCEYVAARGAVKRRALKGERALSFHPACVRSPPSQVANQPEAFPMLTKVRYRWLD